MTIRIPASRARAWAWSISARPTPLPWWSGSTTTTWTSPIESSAWIRVQTQPTTVPAITATSTSPGVSSSSRARSSRCRACQPSGQKLSYTNCGTAPRRRAKTGVQARIARSSAAERCAGRYGSILRSSAGPSRRSCDASFMHPSLRRREGPHDAAPDGVPMHTDRRCPRPPDRPDTRWHDRWRSMSSGQAEVDPVRIAIYVFDGISMFHLAIPQMVFGEVTRQQLASWSTVLFTDRAGSVTTAEGQEISPIAGPEPALTADVVVVPSWFEDGRVAGSRLQELLLEAHQRGAVVAGLCLGALPVADTGMLDGRSAVTHW